MVRKQEFHEKNKLELKEFPLVSILMRWSHFHFPIRATYDNFCKLGVGRGYPVAVTGSTCT